VGFTLIEILVVVAIIGTLAFILLPNFASGRAKARDARRKAEISQLGRLISLSCFTPQDGPGEYDIATLVPEIKTKYPQASQWFTQIPKDPSLGTEDEAKYKYVVNAAGKCAVYANLEDDGQKVTLPALSAPTAGGGTGVLEGSSDGWNGTSKYFQVSN